MLSKHCYELYGIITDSWPSKMCQKSEKFREHVSNYAWHCERQQWSNTGPAQKTDLFMFHGA